MALTVDRIFNCVPIIFLLGLTGVPLYLFQDGFVFLNMILRDINFLLLYVLYMFTTFVYW